MPLSDVFPKGYTNQALAEAIGCTHSTASRLVNGQRLPSIEMIERISDALDIPVTVLLAARKKGATEFGRMMQAKVVRPARRIGA